MIPSCGYRERPQRHTWKAERSAASPTPDSAKNWNKFSAHNNSGTLPSGSTNGVLIHECSRPSSETQFIRFVVDGTTFAGNTALSVTKVLSILLRSTGPMVVLLFYRKSSATIDTRYTLGTKSQARIPKHIHHAMPLNPHSPTLSSLLSTLEPLDVGIIAKVLGLVEWKRVADRLWASLNLRLSRRRRGSCHDRLRFYQNQRLPHRPTVPLGLFERSIFFWGSVFMNALPPFAIECHNIMSQNDTSANKINIGTY